MKWTDTQDIAIALSDAHPDKDPKSVNFVDLYKWVHGAARLQRRPEALRREESSRPSSRPGSTRLNEGS